MTSHTGYPLPCDCRLGVGDTCGTCGAIRVNMREGRREMDDYSALVERLRATIPFINDPVSLKPLKRNRDGDEAAAAIQALMSKVEVARAGLEFYADPENWWGCYVATTKAPMYDDWEEEFPEQWDDGEFPDGKPGKAARAALQKMEE